MENKFRETSCRFHSKDSRKLLVVGYFDENLMGDNELTAHMGQEKLPMEIHEKERLYANILSVTGKVVSKEYFIWITLPENWKNQKNLQIINHLHGEEQVSFRVSKSKLLKMEKRFLKNVDKWDANKDGFSVSGWYVDNGDVELKFFGTADEELDVKVTKRCRVDVKRLFPENSEEEVVGFEAKYKGVVPPRVKLRFSSQDKQADFEIKLQLNMIEKLVEKIKKIVFKIVLYYHQFGLKKTLLRMLDVISRRETITYKAWYKRHRVSKAILKEQRAHNFAYEPKISIVIPLYKTPQSYLAELIDSVKAQSYENWELCLSDGSGTDSPMTAILKQYEHSDERIKVVYNEKALQISDNTNEALKIATGEFIAFADHDDLLAPNALYECVCVINEDDSVDMIYTDEDKIDMAGKEHFMPHFKSDFNIDMLRSVNYFCHLVVVKKEIVNKVGFLNQEFDGAQDYDFVLRCVEVASNIKHIAKILYHWRAHKDSTAENPESKNYAFVAGAKAIKAHYDRVGIKATVEEGQNKGIYRSRYALQSTPLISIVIPNKDHIADLDKCITSIVKKSTYENYEFIIVENNSTEKETFEYYKNLEKTVPKAKVVYWKEQGFNYPAINNYGVEQAKGEYLLFLNNDTEIVNEDCLEEMLGYCMRDDVGAVGARLYYEDGTIQHAGVVVGYGGIAGHAFLGAAHFDLGYFGRIQMAQDYSAVTAACMMVKRTVFEEVNGFDEEYAVAFNDIDLCLKIRRAGYLIVYNPYAELNHYESKSRGYEDTDEKVQRFNAEMALFKERWGEMIEKGDPYYNPNLTLDKSDFSLNIQANKIKK